MAKLRDEISSLQDDVSKANDQVTIHSILVSVKITSEMRFDFVAERPSVNCLFFSQLADSEETTRNLEMELAVSQEKHRICTQEVKT